MNFEMIKQLTEANAIAMKEQQVRDIIIKNSMGDIHFDGLGSVIVRHHGKGPKLMFASHMDEVGFMVRHISDIGLLHVIAIGGVEQQAKSYQKVIITKQDNSTQLGLLHCVFDEHNHIKDMYVDIGVDNEKAVFDAGIQIGDMITYNSETVQLNADILMAKALDNRIGCYILQEVERKITKLSHPNDVYLCYTSSEEVGTRGGKCVSQLINPDIIFAVDVASAPVMVPNYSNHRQLGQGFLVVHYDKTMIPNPKLVEYIKNVSRTHNIDFQCDMFSGGGTDAALSHLRGGGKLAIVLGIPIRYCHGSYSMVHRRDVDSLVSAIVELIHEIDDNEYQKIKKFD